MKQKHIITFVLILINSQIFGQTLKVSSEIGIKGGALYTVLKNQYDSPLEYESKSGFSAGVFYRLNDIIGSINFQAEFLYQLKGVRINYNLNYYGGGYGYGYGGGYGYDSYGYGGYGYPQYIYNYDLESSVSSKNSENYHYFTVPLLLSVKAFKFLDIYVGPELAYMFSESKERNLTIDLNKLTAGIAAGFAIHLGENTKLDLRYSTDFTNVYDEEQIDLKYQSFAFTVQQTLFKKLKF